MKTPLLLAVLHNKGGAGKTTTATNLAAACHLAGLATQLVDADPMAGAFEWACSRDRAARSGAPSLLDGLVTVRVDRPMRSGAYREMASRYDVTIVDGPPRLNEIVASAAVAADIIVIPCQPTQADLTPLTDFLRMLDEAGELRAERGQAPSRRGFVINRAVAGTGLHRQAFGALEAHGEVLGTFHNRVGYQEAYGCGESVLTLEPEGPAAREVRRVARALGLLGAQVPAGEVAA
jgi:chromosome partitioning protein